MVGDIEWCIFVLFCSEWAVQCACLRPELSQHKFGAFVPGVALATRLSVYPSRQRVVSRVGSMLWMRAPSTRAARRDTASRQGFVDAGVCDAQPLDKRSIDCRTTAVT